MSLVIGEAVVEWVALRTNEYGNFGSATALGWERDGRLKAGVVYAEWNGPNVVCHIASDGSKNWATKSYLWTIFDYPFTQLGCKRITVCVGDGNHASKAFVRHLGFELEATLDSAHPSGSLLVFRMFRQDCRYLRMPYANLHKDSLRLAA